LQSELSQRVRSPMTEGHDETSESVLLVSATKRPTELEGEEMTENAMKRAKIEDHATDVEAPTVTRKRWRSKYVKSVFF
jgi:hypothetical protein